MNPRKRVVFCGFLFWLMLLVVSSSLPAEAAEFDFGTYISGANASYGLNIYQYGSGNAIEGSAGSSGVGVYGLSATGKGVHGASGTSYGVYGRTSSDTYSGVMGYNDSTLGGYGVYGWAINGTGVYGYTEGANASGVIGFSEIAGIGVAGLSPDGTGVYGKSDNGDMAGVEGKNTSSGAGVYGHSEYGSGVVGDAGYNGVVGYSHSPDGAGGSFVNTAEGYGVYAETNTPLSAARPTIGSLNMGSGYAVQALSSKGTAVAGKGLKIGIHGTATTTKTKATGVYGTASGASGVGVEGYARKGKGIQGTTQTGAGVYGVATEGGWAGKFQGYKDASGVLITTNGGPGLVVSGGSKSAVVPTSQGSRLLYAEEATEVYFTDYGTGNLTDGKAVISVDPLFAETVNLGQPYHVFVQSYSDAQLVVSRRTPQAFEVRLHARDTEGDRNAEFSYRLVAKRKGFEQARLEPSPSDKYAAKQMAAATSGELDQQAWLSIPEPADLSEPTKPSVPRSPLVEPPLRPQPNGTGK